MVDLLKGILANMEKQKECYCQLVELSTSKTDIIINKQIKDLEKIVDVEQGLILKAGKLESQRQELIRNLAEIKNVDPASITLSILVDWSQVDMKEQFKNLQTELGKIIDRQRYLNEVNSKLIKTDLEYIDIALSLMTDEGVSGQVYEKKGQVSKGGQKRNLFDSKA